MRHEQYTCDRCHGKVDGSPKHQGPWIFTIGHVQILKREMFGSGHLCEECFNLVKEVTAILWMALFPKLRDMKSENDDDTPF